MTVTIATTYSATDLNEGGGVSPGVPILAAPLQTLAANHNFARARFTPPIFYALKGAGYTHGAGVSAYRDLLGAFIPAHSDSQGLTVTLQAKVSSGTGVIRVYLNAGVETISLTDTSFATKTVTFSASSSSPFFLRIQAQGRVTIGCALAYWTPYSGTISDAIQSSGFRWAQSGEFANTEPLTVEQANRFLEMPRLIASKVPQCAYQLFGNLTDGGFASTTLSSQFVTVHRSKILIKHACQLAWYMFSVGPSGSQAIVLLRSADFEETTSTINAPATALPTNPGGSYSAGAGSMTDVAPGLYSVEVKLKSGSSGTAHTLYSLQAAIYPPT